MAKILDGTALAQQVRAEVQSGVEELTRKTQTTPGLAVALVGERRDPASAIYVRNKRRACEEAGIFSETEYSPSPPARLINRCWNWSIKYNRDPRFHGLLVQLPLPGQVDAQGVIETIDPRKDVDGIHPANIGRLVQGRPVFVPGTPAAVQQILLRNGYDPAGKRVVICGRSEIVGKPLAMLMMQRQEGANATVTICHTRTHDLAFHTRQADILVAATGTAQDDHRRHGQGRRGGYRRGHQPD